DAANLAFHGRSAQLGQRDAGNVEVHRGAAHMLGIVSNARRILGQHGVGGGGAIGGDDVDRLGAADVLIDLPDEVEQARVHLGRFVATPVAQEIVKLVQAGLNILTVALEDDARGFL